MSEELPTLAPEHCQQPHACHVDGWGPHDKDPPARCKIEGKCKLCGAKLCTYAISNGRLKWTCYGDNLIPWNVAKEPHCGICMEALIETEKLFPTTSLLKDYHEQTRS